MTAHDLHDKCALMWVRRADNGIDGFNNAMQFRIGADGHVCATEIIIDRANHTSNMQNTILFALLIADPFRAQQIVEQSTPFLTE